jgi:colanic acid/amylovoran biosynthesis glycosyltransferase
LFWIEPFIGKKFDLAHCHFGTVANNFLIIKKILGLRQKIVTTFYGYDASRVFKENRSDYYDELKKESSLFFAMSNNMKERLVAQGFENKKIKVLPVSIDLQSYPYKERKSHDGEPVNIISVGRFVEKKGFDDLLRALAIVKQKSRKAFKCYIIGNGMMKDELYALTEQLKLNDIIEYKGSMNMEAIIAYFRDMHLFVQPSKTARNGDME